MRTKEQVDSLIKSLYTDGNFELNPERAKEFVGTPVSWRCPHSDTKVDRVVWFHFSFLDGERCAVKACAACTKRIVAEQGYSALGVVCRTSKVILDYEGVKDVIRTRETTSNTELGRRLEKEVLDEALKRGTH
jgi:hypothetical protein